MEPEQNNVDMGQEKKGSAGPMIGVIVVLVIIILGALYFWGQNDDSDVMIDETLDTITTQSESDETASIEADLNATDVEGVDSELNTQ